MNKINAFTATAVTGVLAAGTAFTVAASADEQPHRHRVHHTMTFAEPFGGGKTEHIDLGSKGIGPGDLFLATGVPLFSESTGRRIGALDGTEIILAAAHDGVVDQDLTLRFRRGLVMLGGVVRHDAVPLRIPVVGGTGRYANARGQLTEVREDDERKVTILRLDLVL